MRSAVRTFSIWILSPICLPLFLGFGPMPPAFAQLNCLAVNGLTFERVDTFKLLAIRDGQNIAFVNMSSYGRPLPPKLSTFRFFSPNLCSSGAEDKLTIDGVLYEVSGFQMFKR